RYRPKFPIFWFNRHIMLLDVPSGPRVARVFLSEQNFPATPICFSVCQLLLSALLLFSGFLGRRRFPFCRLLGGLGLGFRLSGFGWFLCRGFGFGGRGCSCFCRRF